MALRLLVLSEDEWLDVLGGRRDEDRDHVRVDKELLGALRKYAADIRKTKEDVNDVRVGDVIRNSLRDRWQQIDDLVEAATNRITK